MGGRGPKWTEKQLQTLIEMTESGRSDAQIADRMVTLRGKPITTAAIQIQRCKIRKAKKIPPVQKHTRWTDYEKHLLEGLARDGFTPHEIAKCMNAEPDFGGNFTSGGIYTQSRRMGLPTPKDVGKGRLWTGEENELLIFLIHDNPPNEPEFSLGDIADFFEEQFEVPFEKEWIKKHIVELVEIGDITSSEYHQF